MVCFGHWLRRVVKGGSWSRLFLEVELQKENDVDDEIVVDVDDKIAVDVDDKIVVDGIDAIAGVVDDCAYSYDRCCK